MNEIKPFLKILLMDGNPFDMILIKELIQSEIRESVFYCAVNKQEYLEGLDLFVPDIILSDNCFPKFTAAEALGVLRKRSLEIPFIFVTGSISEDNALAIIEQGANDYILKDRLARLPIAIEAALKRQHAYKEPIDYRYALNQAAIVAITDPQGFITDVNENYCLISGYQAEEITGESHHIRHAAFYQSECLLAIQSGAVWQGEFLNLAKNGNSYWLHTIVIPFSNAKKETFKYMLISKNITEKKKLEGALKEHQKNEKLKMSSLALEVQKKERNIIGRELHDNVNQLLIAIKLSIAAIIESPENTNEGLLFCNKYIDNAIEENRKIARDLMGPDIESSTLQERLKMLIETMLTVSGVNATIDVNFLNENLLSIPQKITVYRVAQEQCSNIVKHTNAKNVFIILRTSGGVFKMSIKDDGQVASIDEKAKGRGLKNIADRIEMFNGTVDVISLPGFGFTVEVEIPLNSQLFPTTLQE
jgi:PAS domain S-box-containing protein